MDTYREFDPTGHSLPQRLARWTGCCAVAACLLTLSCHVTPKNSSFDISSSDASALLLEMSSDPVELERPVVVVAGYLDPSLGSWWLASRFANYTGDDRFLSVGSLSGNFDDARTRLIEAVDARWPSDSTSWTAEVDVIGISMGGLLTRYAAAPSSDFEGDGPPRRRLRVRRLFSLSSPHRGARFAQLPCFLQLHRDMRSDSEFIRRLNEADADRDYDVIPYVRLGDLTVGAENAAPPGQLPYWVSDRWFQPAHVGAVLDARIHADIARQLRGEERLSSPVASRLP
ncbi:MAG: hypothetical protein AAF517_25770 [Planctomycetota bacterium]